MLEYIHMDSNNNQYSLKSNYSLDIVNKICSMDQNVLNFGRTLVTYVYIVQNNMYILNGRTLGDRQGQFSCYTSQGAVL